MEETIYGYFEMMMPSISINMALKTFGVVAITALYQRRIQIWNKASNLFSLFIDFTGPLICPDMSKGRRLCLVSEKKINFGSEITMHEITIGDHLRRFIVISTPETNKRRSTEFHLLTPEGKYHTITPKPPAVINLDSLPEDYTATVRLTSKDVVITSGNMGRDLLETALKMITVHEEEEEEEEDDVSFNDEDIIDL